MSSARCAGCDLPVEVIGDTCGLACYRHMCAMLNFNPNVGEELHSLDEQPWYEGEMERIRKVAAAHELDASGLRWMEGQDEDPPVH